MPFVLLPTVFAVGRTDLIRIWECMAWLDGSLVFLKQSYHPHMNVYHVHLNSELLKLSRVNLDFIQPRDLVPVDAYLMTGTCGSTR